MPSPTPHTYTTHASRRLPLGIIKGFTQFCEKKYIPVELQTCGHDFLYVTLAMVDRKFTQSVPFKDFSDIWPLSTVGVLSQLITFALMGIPLFLPSQCSQRL